MKVSRRSFIGAISSAILMAKNALGFQKKTDPSVEALRYSVADKLIEPHKSVAYVYNAGMDITGIQGQTFNTIKSLPGGEVTRITQCEEWSARGVDDWNTLGQRTYSTPGRFARFMGIRPRVVGYRPSYGERMRSAGLYRSEQVYLGSSSRLDYDSIVHINPTLCDRYFTAPQELSEAEWDVINTNWYEEPNYETRYVIIHPAREMADHLSGFGSPSCLSDQQLVVLRFWDDKEVDIDWVNSLIHAETFSERMAKLSLLRDQKEYSLLTLRATLIPAISAHVSRLRTRLARDLATSSFSSSWRIRACKLLGIDERRLTQEFSGLTKEWQKRAEWIERHALPSWGTGV